MTLTSSAAERAATPLDPDELRLIDAYWRAANYLSVGQIYLLDNPLLREPLRPEHVKPRLLGHWGTTPGLNLIYAHMNRVIRARRPRRASTSSARGTAARRSSPTPGSRAPTARSTRASPATRTACAGCSASSRSRAASRATSRRRRPGSIHEGGELGYALSHAYGAAFDNPDLLVCCVVGDGEAETGPLATSWHSNKFLEPGRPTAPSCRSCTSTATRSRTRPCSPASRPTSSTRCIEGYGYRPYVRRGRRSGGRAPAAGRDAGRRDRRDRDHPAGGPGGRGHRTPALADDRAADAQGLDGAEGGRRPAGRGHLARAPGADGRGAHERGPPGAARDVAAQLPRPRSCSTSTAPCAPSSPRSPRRGRGG